MSQQSQNILAQLRFQDNSKNMLPLSQNQIFRERYTLALLHLLEICDQYHIPSHCKFVARTLLNKYLENQIALEFHEFKILIDIILCLTLELCSNNLLPLFLNQYPSFDHNFSYYSHTHDTIKFELETFYNTSISSPYQFMEYISQKCNLGNRARLSISMVIDYCLSIGESCYFSGEEIYLASVLFIGGEVLGSATMSYITNNCLESLSRGSELKELLCVLFEASVSQD